MLIHKADIILTDGQILDNMMCYAKNNGETALIFPEHLQIEAVDFVCGCVRI